MYWSVFLMVFFSKKWRVPAPAPLKLPHTLTPSHWLALKAFLVNLGRNLSLPLYHRTILPPCLQVTRNVDSAEYRTRIQSASVQC